MKCLVDILYRWKGWASSCEVLQS